jgi:hypothetical protein
MSRLITAVAITAVLAGCDGTNPFMTADVSDAVMGATPTESGADIDPDNIYARGLNADLTMNSFEYDDQRNDDPADDVLLVNNIPFDNSDSSGGGYIRSAATLPNAFEVYESVPSSGGDRQYYAVFRQANYSEVAAVGTGDYISFGFGGATAQRLTNTIELPPTVPTTYKFTGDYAAIRVTTDAGGRDDVEYITGDAILYADLADFDLTGAVDGNIENRILYDVDGSTTVEMTDDVFLGTADIDPTTGIIGASTATGKEGDTELASGQWQGLFAGPEGAEIAGFVVLEGATTSAETPTDTVRETGTFIVVR